MEPLVLALVIGGAVGAAALVMRRRQTTDVPTQPRHQVPTQIDRGDFDRPDADWLVAVFTSATCHVCADVARKAAVLSSATVAVHEVEFQSDKALHERYSIDAVPAVVIADSVGVVHRSFLGPVTATDLWVAVAECREPGSTPTATGCQRHDHDDHDDHDHDHDDHDHDSSGTAP